MKKSKQVICPRCREIQPRPADADTSFRCCRCGLKLRPKAAAANTKRPFEVSDHTLPPIIDPGVIALYRRDNIGATFSIVCKVLGGIAGAFLAVHGSVEVVLKIVTLFWHS